MHVQTMTFEQFFAGDYPRTFTAQQLDAFIGHLRRHKKLYRRLVVFVAICGLCGLTPSSALAAGVSTKVIDSLGLRLLGLVRVIGYWVIIVKGSIETIGAAAQGDSKTAFKIFMNHLFIFAVLFLFPLGLDMIKEAFSQ